MIIRKLKIVKLGFLRLPEYGDYNEQVKTLCSYIDCQLSLQRQINILCSNSFHLRKVWSIRDQVKTLIPIVLIGVAVLPRVGYCNLLYYGLPKFC